MWNKSVAVLLKAEYAFTNHSSYLNCFTFSHLSSPLMSSLIRELKERVVEFPDVTSGVYIHEVIPGTAAYR